MPSDRLLVPLDRLPGFDPTGLLVSREWTDGSFDRNPYVCVAANQHAVTARCGQPSTGWLEGRENVRVSLADAATRDRIARFIAGRVGLDVGATAPDWGPNYGWDIYGWTLGDNHAPGSVMFMPPEMIGRRTNWIRCSRRIPMPGLPNPDGRDRDDLSDGVDRMVARALGIVAVALAEVSRGR